MTLFHIPPLHVSCIVKAPCHTVWERLVNTKYWSTWGPSVSSVRCPSDRIEAGVSGYVRTRLGFWVPFHIDHWEEDRFWSWRVFGFRATGHRVETIKPGLCRLSIDVPWWAAPYVIVCKIAIHRIAMMAEHAKEDQNEEGVLQAGFDG